MGKAGTKPALLVSGAGYFIKPTPVTRERAAEILGAPIADGIWREIEREFGDLQARLVHDAQAVRAAYYGKARRVAERDIAKALAAAMAHAWTKNTRTMEDMAHRSPGGMAGTLDIDISEHLSQAALHLGTALHAIRSAKPEAMRIPTTTDAKAYLVQRLRAILRRAGLPVNLSDRRNLPDKPSEADLTPFERLLSEAEVHVADTPDAMAKWVGEASSKGAPKAVAKKNPRT